MRSPADSGEENSPIQLTALHKAQQKSQTFCPDTMSEEEDLEVGARAPTYSGTSCALHHSRERHSPHRLSCVSSWFTLYKQPCPHRLAGTGQTGASNILGSIRPSGMVLSPCCCDSLLLIKPHPKGPGDDHKRHSFLVLVLLCIRKAESCHGPIPSLERVRYEQL